MNRLIHFFVRGGPMMWPILATSLLSWAIIFERIVRLRRKKLFDDDLVHGVRKHLAGGNVDLAQKELTVSRVLSASVITKGIDEYLYTETNVETAMAGAAERQLRVLWNNMIALNTIARVATMLGLLGTVVGMVVGFEELSKSNVDKEKLAQAIGVALTTTVGGLCVAIPAIIGESSLRARIRAIVTEFEEILLEIVKAMHIGRIEKAIRVSPAEPPAAQADSSDTAPKTDAGEDTCADGEPTRSADDESNAPVSGTQASGGETPAHADGDEQ